jgi:predicted CXXCH cytochrome family protein
MSAMRARRTAKMRRPAVILIVAAGGIFLPAFSVSGATARPALQILAPGDGAVLPQGKVLVVGRAAGKGMARVDIDVNGRSRQTVPVVAGGFSATVSVPPGRNVLRAVSGGTEARAALTGAAKGSFRYHPGVEKCGDCHGKAARGYSLPPPTESLCHRCHSRRDKGKMVHGPIGNGDCAACHEPHGSSHKALARERHETLCVTCHDQQSSAAHFKRSRGKACTSCHEPHSSSRPFLQR